MRLKFSIASPIAKELKGQCCLHLNIMIFLKKHRLNSGLNYSMKYKNTTKHLKVKNWFFKSRLLFQITFMTRLLAQPSRLGKTTTPKRAYSKLKHTLNALL